MKRGKKDATSWLTSRRWSRRSNPPYFLPTHDMAAGYQTFFFTSSRRGCFLMKTSFRSVALAIRLFLTRAQNSTKKKKNLFFLASSRLKSSKTAHPRDVSCRPSGTSEAKFSPRDVWERNCCFPPEITEKERQETPAKQTRSNPLVSLSLSPSLNEREIIQNTFSKRSCVRARCGGSIRASRVR